MSRMIAPVCPAPPSALYTFSPSLSQEGGRLPPPFGVTRETGAWVWGGALASCLPASGSATEPLGGQAASQRRRKWVSAGLGRGLGRGPLVSFVYRCPGRLESVFSSLLSFQRD